MNRRRFDPLEHDIDRKRNILLMEKTILLLLYLHTVIIILISYPLAPVKGYDPPYELELSHDPCFLQVMVSHDRIRGSDPCMLVV
jgi:hypothetical protein